MQTLNSSFLKCGGLTALSSFFFHCCLRVILTTPLIASVVPSGGWGRAFRFGLPWRCSGRASGSSFVGRVGSPTSAAPFNAAPGGGGGLLTQWIPPNMAVCQLF